MRSARMEAREVWTFGCISDSGRTVDVAAQKAAIALSGDPVPPATGIGPAMSMNSQRFSTAAVSASP